MKVGDLVYWVYADGRVMGLLLETDVIPSAGRTQHRIIVDNTRLVVSAGSLEVISESR